MPGVYLDNRREPSYTSGIEDLTVALGWAYGRVEVVRNAWRLDQWCQAREPLSADASAACKALSHSRHTGARLVVVLRALAAVDTGNRGQVLRGGCRPVRPVATGLSDKERRRTAYNIPVRVVGAPPQKQLVSRSNG